MSRARRVLARALWLRTASSNVGICAANAETEMSMAAALMAEAAASGAPAA